MGFRCLGGRVWGMRLGGRKRKRGFRGIVLCCPFRSRLLAREFALSLEGSRKLRILLLLGWKMSEALLGKTLSVWEILRWAFLNEPFLPAPAINTSMASFPILGSLNIAHISAVHFSERHPLQMLYVIISEADTPFLRRIFNSFVPSGNLRGQSKRS